MLNNVILRNQIKFVYTSTQNGIIQKCFSLIKLFQKHFGFIRKLCIIINFISEIPKIVTSNDNNKE